MIIAVSDVHLGADECKRDDFLDFINNLEERQGENHFLLIGDIIEFSLRDMTNAIQENEDILLALKSLKSKGYKVLYIEGNHDIRVREMAQNKQFPFEICHFKRLSLGGRKFFFLHGYELEVWTLLNKDINAYEKLFWKSSMKGEIEAKILGRIWKFVEPLWDFLKSIWYALTRNDIASKINRGAFKTIKLDIVETLAFSPMLNMFLPIEEGEVLVFGHTHRPFLTRRVINTGSWLENAKYKYRTYLTIEDDGKVQLGEWKEGREHDIPAEDESDVLEFSRQIRPLMRKLMAKL